MHQLCFQYMLNYPNNCVYLCKIENKATLASSCSMPCWSTPKPHDVGKNKGCAAAYQSKTCGYPNYSIIYLQTQSRHGKYIKPGKCLHLDSSSNSGTSHGFSSTLQLLIQAVIEELASSGRVVAMPITTSIPFSKEGLIAVYQSTG